MTVATRDWRKFVDQQYEATRILTMRVKIFLTVTTLVFAIGVGAALRPMKILRSIPRTPRIGFKVNQAFATVTGRFKEFGGTITLDREHPEKSSVMATIQVKSIDTGIAKRDAHLCSPEFFNAPKFPEITFKSRSVKQTGPDAGDILGDFTMHGVTKPITLHVKLLTKTAKNDALASHNRTVEPTRVWSAVQQRTRRHFDDQRQGCVDIEIVATAAR